MRTEPRRGRSSRDRVPREGRPEGRAAILLRLPARRFGALPATVTRRVRLATAANLERWSDRILAAKSLRELFAQ